MAVLNEREAQNAESAGRQIESSPGLAPPPVPLRRPEGIPEASKTAALGGWAPTKFTTTEVVAPRSVRVAILLRGLGRDDKISGDAVTNLPPAISLAFMPYYTNGHEWARKARASGHEVIVQLPLEPSDYPVNNPGPETLLSSSSADENLSRMRTVLARFDGYSGVTNFLGGKILQSKSALKPILEEVKTQGLIYVGEGNNSHALLRGIAKDIGLRYGGADVVIDVYPSPDAIKKALDQLVSLARKRGSAIGMGSASRNTIEQLQAWSQTLARQGITLVPVGVLAQTPGAS
ncbi:MAG: divergent polysaccharide deacetylase family protein [Rhodomicrobium sp.]|nr:divergent polysaccharide deacetylase family protein [Rhodomicrobium sp.]